MIWRPVTQEEAIEYILLTKATGCKIGIAVVRFLNDKPASYWHAIGYEQEVTALRAEMPYCFLSWNAAIRRQLKMIEDRWIGIPTELIAQKDKTVVRVVAWRLTDWYPEQTEIEKYKKMECLFDGSAQQ